jgi:L-methionine (R)-S-oxide reductase
MNPALNRPYRQIAECMVADGTFEQRMETVVDHLWNLLKNTGVSWVGFYLPDGEQMVLGPCRDKPACSPIGLHGACGQAFTKAEPIVVQDVAELGEGYIACDPRDRSEVVVPMIDPLGRCRGVLDLDSHEVGAFSEDDAAGLTRVLRAVGLTR